MDCPESSEAQDHRGDGDTQTKEMLETSDQSKSTIDNATTDERVRKVEANRSGPEEKDGKVEQIPTGSKSEVKSLGELAHLKKAIEFREDAVSLTADGHPNKPGYLDNLGNLYGEQFGSLSERSDLNKAIESQAQAVLCIPDGHQNKPAILNSLGNSYVARFERGGEVSDMNEAIKSHAQAVLLTADNHPDKPRRLSNFGNSYRARFGRLGELSDLKEAIKFGEEAVSLTADGHPNKPGYLNNLGNMYGERFGRLGEPSDLNKSIEYQAEAVSLTPDGHPFKPVYLNSLGVSHMFRFGRLGELSDLNKSIEFYVQAIFLTPDAHPDKPARLSNLGNSYGARFRRLGELSDLNKAIEFKAQAVSLTPDGHPDKPAHLNTLGVSYETRFSHLSELSDLQSAESCYRRASQSPTGVPFVRFSACKKWAKLCLHDALPSPLPAYQYAMSLIPRLVWVGTTIDRRYELVTFVSSFTTEAVSYAISAGAYSLALEWLEAGRSIVWGQIAQLRTPFEHLSEHSPDLAEELASIRSRLEHAATRSSLSPSPETGDRDLNQVAHAHVQSALEWDRLLTKIRLMPGFEDFLSSPSASRLLSAAKHHPIAVINLHKSRCDALILRPDSDTISHIPLTNFSIETAVSTRNHVLSHVRSRKPGPRLNPLGGLETSLEDLWSGVVKPVLGFLGYTRKLPADQLPHLTWSTTGLLSFLPFHAARSHDKSQPSAFDLVISSYTPTLSALLSSQSTGQSVDCGILAVSQEDTPGLSSLPCTTRELSVIRERTKSNRYHQIEGDEATIERVLEAMDQFSWVHMACHGSQNADDPTQSAFHLHDGNLTLGAITKRSFTNKGLAFLSACQTATGDKNIPDEAVHLAAGMLMAGYPSVIGTMWSIIDEDGPDVADQVYAELLVDGKMDHTKSARALHQAISCLRAKVGEENISRWAPFIHIGS